MTAIISELGDKVAEALRAVRRPGPYALVDFPDYGNVGDSAIWLGEIELLRRVYGQLPSYVSRIENFDDDQLAARVPDGTIYLQGGGNFGDLYPKHQLFRERLMRRYGSRVVQLPQSLHYSQGADQAAIRAVANSGAALMVRDQASLELGSDLGFRPMLVPDSAFGIGPIAPIGAAVQDVLVLKRDDQESANPFSGGVDWLEEPAGTRRAARLVSLLRPALPSRLNYYQALAQRRLDRGVAILSRGRTVATDRLHAHIISLLLGIPHSVADNSTGKIHGFIDQWTARSPLVSKVTDLSHFGTAGG